MFKAHWNCRYVVNRSKEFLFRKLNPRAPWLTPDAISFLQLWLSEKDVGLEFGSGRSTLWFAARTKWLISIEDNHDWFAYMTVRIKHRNVLNVDYKFHVTHTGEYPSQSEYTKPLLEFPDEHFNYILVDGTHRDFIALNALSKLKVGGIMIVDNANWFLPHETYSPTSIGGDQPPLNENWKKFHINVAKWREIWTSNGVTDTAIYIKA